MKQGRAAGYNGSAVINTDGELFDVKLEWQPSFRLRRPNDTNIQYE